MPISMFAAHPLVHVNAALNCLATLLLIAGFVLIKRGQILAHKRTMLLAFGASTAFLACYLWYHYLVGSVRFTHEGVVRYVYYPILLSHVLLAFTVPVLAIWTIYLGLRATGSADSTMDDSVASRFRRRHRRLARWTFPIWLYVSVTGVMVYVMLYHLWPSLEL